jgi:hypothetical protein
MDSEACTMYSTIFFEVSGICNARCPWCVTGNRSGLQAGGKFIEPDLFRHALERIRELSLAAPDAVISLYNWGEIFLHPQIDDLLKILARQKLRFAISTNSSRLKPLPQESLAFLDHVIFSMPGFSQGSYDRIHGFNFNEITGSIVQFVDDARSRGCSGRFRMAYHIYQFNIAEIPPAYEFCLEHEIEFTPVIANMGDFDLACRYRDGTLDTATLQKAGHDLLLYYVDSVIARRPADYACPQHSVLSLDEYANVLTCCAVPRKCDDYSLGSLFDLNADQIEVMKKNRNICGKCRSLGVDYWGSNPAIPTYVPLFKSLVEYTGRPQLPPEAEEHYTRILSGRMQEFFKNIRTLLETGRKAEAFTHYEQYRWCFPDIPVMKNVDAMMAEQK